MVKVYQVMRESDCTAVHSTSGVMKIVHTAKAEEDSQIAIRVTFCFSLFFSTLDAHA